MKRISAALILASLVLLTSGCGEKKSFTPAGAGGARFVSMNMALSAASPERFIAEHHTLEIITPESELQKSWESAIAFCGTIQCEVITSTISSKTRDSVPSGDISLRVVPQDLKTLLAHLERLGTVAKHTTEREDKTATVVDTDAKLKNLITFRDNLRAMLSKPSATVKDLIDIQQQLTETQSQLDSETALRKRLANETEKIAVAISFRVESTRISAGGFAQIREALRESGSVLGESAASLITVIVAVIPWLILIVPGAWLVRRAWRKFRRRRTIETS